MVKDREAELKGAPFEKRMFKQTPEGITLKPIYCQSDIAKLPQTEAYPGSAPSCGEPAPAVTRNCPG